MNAAGLAVGDLTHGLAPAGVPVPGISFGTDMAEIFNLIGSTGYSARDSRRPARRLRRAHRDLIRRSAK